MDELIGLLFAILLWRIALAAFFGFAVGMAAAQIFPGFGAGAVATVTLLALFGGVMWHASAIASAAPADAPKAEQQPISRPIAFLGIALVGLLVGSVYDYLLSSGPIALSVLIVSSIVLVCVGGAITKTPVYLTDLLFMVAALVTGFVTPWAIVTLLS
ncbi:hypothetical protein [Variovorax boronicumulans]|uniref:hypothetical protein n=1 Tax=Variovorax boronicumulans TaxID=436515 RepID=UPI002476A5E1|nr:hypothetical protein [Variovorax boronicumulans]